MGRKEEPERAKDIQEIIDEIDKKIEDLDNLDD